jgi:hypothetical protein
MAKVGSTTPNQGARWRAVVEIAIDFAVSLVVDDGLRIGGLDRHPARDGPLQRAGMSPALWHDWIMALARASASSAPHQIQQAAPQLFPGSESIGRLIEARWLDYRPQGLVRTKLLVNRLRGTMLTASPKPLRVPPTTLRPITAYIADYSWNAIYSISDHQVIIATPTIHLDHDSMVRLVEEAQEKLSNR